MRPNDLHLTGVGADKLNILGAVRLPVSLGKSSPPLHFDFYVLSQFALPCDGLIGFPSLESHDILIDTELLVIHYAGRQYRAMAVPTRFSLQWEPKTRHRAPLTAAPVHLAQPQPSDVLPRWNSVNEVVLDNHEIPHRFAVRVPVSLAEPVDSADCFDAPSLVQALTLEPILATVRDGNTAETLVVNNSGGPVRLRKGVVLTRALAYGAQVTSQPLDLPSFSISEFAGVQLGGENTNPKLDNHVNVKDYPELRARLLETLNRYRDTIALSGEALGATSLMEHNIKLKPGTRQVYIPAYRVPHSQRQVVSEQIEEMLEQGVIQHSTSPWNSPLFLVPKKDGQFRPVIAFRKVNKENEDDRYPLPVLSDILMNLGQGNTIFSSLDLVSGYWHFHMAPEARAITVFSTPSGHFDWLRMPFGLKSAPITFQRLMNALLGDLLGKDVFAYLDDLIICSKDAYSHFISLEAVLDKLRTAGLKLKLSKCAFMRAKIPFLGHMVDSSGIHTQAYKIEAIRNLTQPRSVENVRSFLGLCGYYRPFISGFAKIYSPLNQLSKKGVSFHWDSPQQKSFDALKTALISALVLQFPN